MCTSFANHVKTDLVFVNNKQYSTYEQHEQNISFTCMVIDLIDNYDRTGLNFFFFFLFETPQCPSTNWANVFRFLSSLPLLPQPSRQCLGTICRLSTVVWATGCCPPLPLSAAKAGRNQEEKVSAVSKGHTSLVSLVFFHVLA